MMLSEKELRKLTRRKRPSAQMRVLSEARISYVVVDGRPVVMQSAIGHTHAERFQPELKLVR